MSKSYFHKVSVDIVRIRPSAGFWRERHSGLGQGNNIGVAIFSFTARRKLIWFDGDHWNVGEFLINGWPVSGKTGKPREIHLMRNRGLHITKQQTYIKNDLANTNRIMIAYIFCKNSKNTPTPTSVSARPTEPTTPSIRNGPAILWTKTTQITHRSLLKQPGFSNEHRMNAIVYRGTRHG